MATGLKGYPTRTSGPGTYSGEVTVTSKPGDKIALDTCNLNTSSQPVEVGRAENWFITRATAVAANTEFSFSFPAGTKKFTLKKRTGAGDLRIAVVSGQAAAGATDHLTLESLAALSEEDLKIPAGGLTIYMEMQNIANPYVEISYWT